MQTVRLNKIAAIGLALAVSFTGFTVTTVPAGAQEAKLGGSEVLFVNGRSVHDELESELQYLSTLTDAEFDDEFTGIIAEEQEGNVSPRIAPLVVVGAIGCAISTGNGIFNTDWSDGKDAAWSLAGAIASCVPLAQPAKVFNVIVRNKDTIVKALKRVGAGSLAAAIAGAHITIVPE